MIEFVTGDMFKSTCKVLVNATNCVGVMGGGLAAAFIKHPDYKIGCNDYNIWSQEQNPFPGPYKLLEPILSTGARYEKYVLQFPTKIDWRNPSKLEYVEKGMPKAVEILNYHTLKSVAFPKLGCGLGGLDWNEVKPVMLKALELFEGELVEIYE